MTNDQAPMTNKAPMSNDQLGHLHWSFGIGHLLVIGIWSLVIPLVGHWDLVIGHSTGSLHLHSGRTE